MKLKQYKRVYLLILLLTIALIFVLSYCLIDFYKTKNYIYNQTYEHTNNISLNTVNTIQNNLNSFTSIIENIAVNIQDIDLLKEDILNFMKESLKSDFHFYKIEAVFGTEAENYKISNIKHTIEKKLNNDTIIFAVYRLKNNNSPEWFTFPIKYQKPFWSDPYFDYEYNYYSINYSVPFYLIDSTPDIPDGVINVRFNLSGIRRIFENLFSNEYGYSIVYNSNYNYVYHFSPDYIKNVKNILEDKDFKNLLEDNVIEKIKTLSSDEKTSIITSKYDNKRKDTIINIRPIKSTDWTIINIFFPDNIRLKRYLFTRKKIFLYTVIIVTVIVFSLNIFRYIKLNIKNFWLYSIFVALLFFSGTFYICYLYVSSDFKENNHIKIIDYISAKVAIDNYYKNNPELYSDKPTILSTGIYIQAIEFISNYNVKVNGYIWQKYNPKIISDNITLGFSLPDATKLDYSVAYEHNYDNYNIIGWKFYAEIRQNFDYSRFPFDKQNLWIRILPKKFGENIVLIPDYDSYKNLTPLSLPGIDYKIVTDFMNINSSFFSYKSNFYNTSRGYKLFNIKSNYPEFHFNIIFNRNFISSVFSRFIPVFVILLILFFILLNGTKNEVSLRKRGFSVNGVFATCGAMIFITISEQIHLRKILHSSSLIYLEYFYFLIYFLVILISFNAIIFVNEYKISLLQYKDNIIPKLLYWVFVSVYIFIITLNFFIP